MAKLIVLLVFLVGFTACEVDSIEPPQIPARDTTIVGKWVWYKTFGFGISHTPQTTGQNWVFTFRNDSTYIQRGNYNYIQGSFPDSSGTYSLLRSTYCTGTFIGDFVKFTSPGMVSPRMTMYYFRSADTLLFDTGEACDRPIFYFVRN